MIIGVVVQQPSDVLDYNFDCTPLFNEESDALSGVSATVSPAGLEVSAAAIDDTTVKVWVSEGLAGIEYTIEINVTTEQGRVKQDEFIVAVEEF
jgi:hypothetical protein